MDNLNNNFSNFFEISKLTHKNNFPINNTGLENTCH